MMIALMHFGYQLNLPKGINQLEKLRLQAKTAMITEIQLERHMIGLQVQGDKFALYN